MAFKYKLSEMSKTASPEAAEKELGKPKSGFKVGDVSFSPDGTTKSTIYKIDDETGQISWRIEQLPGYDKLFDELDSLVDTAKRTANKSKDDQKFREFYEQIRQVRNQVRTHLRKFHPEIYRRIQLRMDEAYSGFLRNPEDPDSEKFEPTGAVAEFREELRALFGKFKGELNNREFIGGVAEVMVNWKSLLRSQMNEKEVEEMSTSAGAGSYLTKYAFKKPKKQEKLPEGVGATLGPGPKAGPDGVKDNYYVKKFKYKLVPKNKDGNYVQKGSGLEVKNF